MTDVILENIMTEISRLERSMSNVRSGILRETCPTGLTLRGEWKSR